MLSGSFDIFEEFEDPALLVDMLKASVTFSGVSPAIFANNSLYMTGNAIYENDIMSVINHCSDLGYKDSDIVIDSIISG